MNVRTGKIAWQRDVSGNEVGGIGGTGTVHFNGVCATAGGLVFAAESLNRTGPFDPHWTFSAFSAETGDRLWQWEVPGNVGVQAPCITYSVGGRQFVAVAVGNKAARYGGSPETPHGDYFYAFGLPEQLIQDEK